jgi:hypothetical protein
MYIRLAAIFVSDCVVIDSAFDPVEIRYVNEFGSVIFTFPSRDLGRLIAFGRQKGAGFEFVHIDQPSGE